MEAAYNGHTEVVVKLVKAGADPNLQNDVCHNILLSKCRFVQMYMAGACDCEWETDIKLIVVCAYTQVHVYVYSAINEMKKH